MDICFCDPPMSDLSQRNIGPWELKERCQETQGPEYNQWLRLRPDSGIVENSRSVPSTCVGSSALLFILAEDFPYFLVYSLAENGLSVLVILLTGAKSFQSQVQIPKKKD